MTLVVYHIVHRHRQTCHIRCKGAKWHFRRACQATVAQAATAVAVAVTVGAEISDERITPSMIPSSCACFGLMKLSLSVSSSILSSSNPVYL